MRILNIQDLHELERRIKIQMRQHDLDDVLFGLRNVPDKVYPFMIAGAALFALRYARPPAMSKSDKRILLWDYLKPIIGQVNEYLLADPVSFEPPVFNEYHGSVEIPIFLRTVGGHS